MMESSETIAISVTCSRCGKLSPFDGCDATGCTWRAEAVLSAIAEGALVNVVCKSSDEGRAARRLNVTIEAYRGTKGNA